MGVKAEVPQRAASGVLADRMAAALVHHEPGWQLPRRSALARRYNVSMAEIDVAIAELTRRSLIRRLSDGQLYRASAAEYLIPLEGIGGLSTRLDPMGGGISCTARHVSLRAAPQDVAWSLGVNGDNPVRVIRCTWAAGGEPAAVSTAYVPGTLAAAENGEPVTFQAIVSAPPGGTGDAGGVRARAVDLEMAPPQPSVARSLRLLPGQLAISVTIRFDDRAADTPVGLTAVTLRPNHFRVVIHAGDLLPSLPHLPDLTGRADRTAGLAAPRRPPGGVAAGRRPVQAGSLLRLAGNRLDRRSPSCRRRAGKHRAGGAPGSIVPEARREASCRRRRRAETTPCPRDL